MYRVSSAAISAGDRATVPFLCIIEKTKADDSDP